MEELLKPYQQQYVYDKSLLQPEIIMYMKSRI